MSCSWFLRACFVPRAAMPLETRSKHKVGTKKASPKSSRVNTNNMALVVWDMFVLYIYRHPNPSQVVFVLKQLNSKRFAATEKGLLKHRHAACVSPLCCGLLASFLQTARHVQNELPSKIWAADSSCLVHHMLPSHGTTRTNESPQNL